MTQYIDKDNNKVIRPCDTCGWWYASRCTCERLGCERFIEYAKKVGL